jgi:ribosomal protein S18 acetylase RimI-like enzyme
MNTVTVRQATMADLDALAPLFDSYRQFYGQAGDVDAARAFLRARFDNNESTLFIAFEGDNPAGFAQLYPSFSSVSLARTFILNDLFTDERARRKGVASKLISKAIEFAESMGAARISLSTAITNESAQALYRSTGWKRDEQFQVFHFSLPVKPL